MLSGTSAFAVSTAPLLLQRARSLGSHRRPSAAPNSQSVAPRKTDSSSRRNKNNNRNTKAMASATDDNNNDKESAQDPSPEAPSTAPPNVAELVMLLKIAPDEDANAVLDELWSAQYLAPGTLCAFAGETTTTMSKGGGTAANSSSPSSPSSPPATDFTHALHMRFASAAAAQAFVSHKAFSEAREGAERACCSSSSSSSSSSGGGEKSKPLLVVFSGRVDPPSLETLFRRGAEWESGIEHALLLASTSGEGGKEDGGEEGGEAAADLYVSQLRELAESSLVGAVQSTSGRIAAAAAASPHSATHAVLTRFAGPEQLRAFLELPPVKALLSPAAAEGSGGGESASPPPPPLAPVRAVASAQYNIAPAQGVTGRQGA